MLPMITGEENIQVIAENFPALIPEFEKHGMGSYFKSENLKKIGRFTRLNTLLKSSKIDSTQFIGSLNNILDDKETVPAKSLTEIQQQLHLMAMLPCGLRNPFKDFLEAHILDNSEQYVGLNYLAEGNVNHELSYYPLLDNVSSSDELPDIIIASDVNNCFHRPFLERFVEKDVFETFSPYQPNQYLEKAGYADPSGNFTMFTTNMLVMAVDKSKLGNRKMPEKWSDILAPEFENEIIMRGEDNFFCNAVMLPFYKDHGFEAIKMLARNIKTGKHPAEMVKLAGSAKSEASAIYIMPYFFAKKIKNEQVELVWPKDGAIASPVFMLIKRNAVAKHRPMLEFLLSKEAGEMLVGRHFPSINPEVSNDDFPETVKWLGWEFLNNNDIGKLKEEIKKVFTEERTKNTL